MQMGFYCGGERDLKLGVKTGLIKKTPSDKNHSQSYVSGTEQWSIYLV